MHTTMNWKIALAFFCRIKTSSYHDADNMMTCPKIPIGEIRGELDLADAIIPISTNLFVV